MDHIDGAGGCGWETGDMDGVPNVDGEQGRQIWMGVGDTDKGWGIWHKFLNREWVGLEMGGYYTLYQQWL